MSRQQRARVDHPIVASWSRPVGYQKSQFMTSTVAPSPQPQQTFFSHRPWYIPVVDTDGRVWVGSAAFVKLLPSTDHLCSLAVLLHSLCTSRHDFGSSEQDRTDSTIGPAEQQAAAAGI
jgi:hypothetical protein